MISAAIKAKREEKGWSKKYLADLLGVSSAAIGQYEKGDNKPKVEVLLKLNKVFDYDFINDKQPVIDDKKSIELSQNGNNSKNIKPLGNSKNEVIGDFNLNDVVQVNHNATHAENSTFPEKTNNEKSAVLRPVVDITKWIDPNHIPIPVFDNTYGAETISELLSNDSYKPTVIILKGHLGCNAVVRHVDSAMNKHFPARCQLGIERLKTFKKRIEPGKPYIVVLEEITVTRYVFENDKHFILRSSDVELYPDMPVDKEEIIEMWRIRSLTPIPDQQLF